MFQKKIILLFACILFLGNAYSQDYKTAVGFRLGYSQGVTVKHYISDYGALEGLLTVRWNGVMFTGLFEHHMDIPVDGLNWYVGFGAHVGQWERPRDGRIEDEFTVGADGIIGIQYTIPTVPLNFSVDWKPSINFVGHSGYIGDGGAVSVRYTFK